MVYMLCFFFFQAEDGIRDVAVTGVQTCALPISWVCRLMKVCPVTNISQELVRFDTQALETPDIEGAQYQRGQLSGYEVREYVLLKWKHQCAYCDARDVPLELDHIDPRSRHGSNRVSNLTLACTPCNQRKSNQDVRQFLRDEPERLP